MAKTKTDTLPTSTPAPASTRAAEPHDAPAPGITRAMMDAAQLSPAARALLQQARGGASVAHLVGKVYEFIKPEELIVECREGAFFLVTDAVLRPSNLEDNVQEVLYELTMHDGRELALTLTAVKNGNENRQRTSWVRLFPGRPVGPLTLTKREIESGRWKGRPYTCFVDATTGEIIGGKPQSEDVEATAGA